MEPKNSESVSHMKSFPVSENRRWARRPAGGRLPAPGPGRPAARPGPASQRPRHRRRERPGHRGAVPPGSDQDGKAAAAQGYVETANEVWNPGSPAPSPHPGPVLRLCRHGCSSTSPRAQQQASDSSRVPHRLPGAGRRLRRTHRCRGAVGAGSLGPGPWSGRHVPPPA